MYTSKEDFLLHMCTNLTKEKTSNLNDVLNL